MDEVPAAGAETAATGKAELIPPTPRLRDDTRALALRELAASGPAVPWRKEASWLAATVLGLTATGVVVVLALGDADLEVLWHRLDGVALLLLAQALVFSVALAPGWRARLGAGVLAAAAGGLAVVLLGRADVAGDAAAGHWVCASSHAAGGLLALALVVMRLRGSAFSWRKALLAGLGIGLSGLIWGEIACAHGRMHVVFEHLGGLLFLTVACLVAARLIRPRSFAP